MATEEIKKLNGEDIVAEIQRENTLVMRDGKMDWSGLDLVLDKIESYNFLKEIQIENVDFQTDDDLKDIVELSYNPENKGEILNRISISKIDLSQNLKLASALVTTVKKIEGEVKVELTDCQIDRLFLGFLLGMVISCRNLIGLDISNNKIKDDDVPNIEKALKKRRGAIDIDMEGNEFSEEVHIKLKESFEKLKNGVRIEKKPIQVEKKAEQKAKKEVVRYSIESQNQYPRVKMMCSSGRVLPLKDFYISFKANKIFSIYTLKKEINYTFCKVSGETTTRKTVRNIGNSKRNYVCPVCMNYITIKHYEEKGETQYSFECTYCKWNSIKVGLCYKSFDKTFKSCRIRYKVSAENRAKELITPAKFIKSQLEMSLRKNNIDRQMSSLGETRGRRFGAATTEWNRNQLKSKLVKLFRVPETKRQLKSVVRRFTLGGNQIVDATMDDVIDTKISESDDSSEEEEEEDQTTSEKKQQKLEEEKEKRSLFTVSDFSKLIAGSIKEGVSKEDDILEDYLTHFKEQDWRLAVFERSPIKLYEGEQSLFPLVSEMQAIITKKCPETGEIIMSYESFAKSFKHKYSSMYLEYSPQIKLYKVFKSPENPEGTVYQLTTYNLTKSELKFTLEIDHENSSGGTFAFMEENPDKMEFDLCKRSAAQSSEKKKYRERLQIIYTPSKEEKEDIDEDAGMRTLHVKMNLNIVGTVQNFQFDTVYVFELGDDNVEKQLIEKYKSQFRYR